MDNTMLYTDDISKKESELSAHLSAMIEFRRVLEQGGKLFLTVPFGIASDHGWLQIFDASGIDKIVDAFAPAETREVVYQYMPDGWIVSDRAAAADARYFDIHKQKTYDADYAAAARAVICIEMEK